MREEELLILVGVGIAVLFLLFIQAALCYFWQTCLNSVAPQHRTMAPGLVWIYMIPCINFLWLFFVMINIPKSFQNHFKARGVTDVGDCGQTICLAYAICTLLSAIPYIGCLAALPALVLFFVHIVKFIELKNKAASA